MSISGQSPSSTFSPSRVLASNPRLHLPASTDPPSESNPPTQKVWLVFGATGHLGRVIVKAALSHGDLVAAVGRSSENSVEQMQGWHERCLGLLCDVRVRATVQAVLDKTIAHFGRVDIIVNCTGYGVIAACEDQDACDLHSQFETNFLGTLNIIQLSLPYFRAQSALRKDPDHENAGRYLIFSSTSGALGVPGLGPYCATKYAVEGLIESMLYEIDAFGIKATLVEPGHMRLDEPTGLDDKALDAVLSPSPPPPPPSGSTPTGAPAAHNIKLPRYGHFRLKPSSPPYNTPSSPANHARRVVQWLADRQPSSAVKAAELVWQLGHCRFPPLRLLLGSFAVESVRDRLRSVTEEIEDWKHLNFPAPGGGAGGEEVGGGGGGVNGKERRKGDKSEGKAGEEEEGEEEGDGAGGMDAEGEIEDEDDAMGEGDAEVDGEGMEEDGG